MQLIKSWLALFKSPTIEDDAEAQAARASEDIAQSNATIKRAEYIRHMAEWKLKAVAAWAVSQERSERASSFLARANGDKNG